MSRFGLSVEETSTDSISEYFLVFLKITLCRRGSSNSTSMGARLLCATAIFGIALLTDWLDGYLARRRQQVTTLGQILDPLADKLLIIAPGMIAAISPSRKRSPCTRWSRSE